jgi:acetate kinase
MNKNVLVFNCGSSSLKYRMIGMPGEVELAGGEAQRVGPHTTEPSQIIHRVGGDTQIQTVSMPDHKTAFVEVMKLLTAAYIEPDIIGHRLVHGGEVFPGTALLDSEMLGKLRSVEHLAPIHNPPAVALVRACSELYPRMPQILVFDTSFHSTIPDYANTYPLPRWLREDMGIRKYGFHGTSHRYVAEEAARFLDIPMNELNAVSCHLGSGGASLCAIVDGKSVDNTMGYSPLQGLLMSTRSGDLDPAVVMRLLARNGGDASAVEQLLNKKSGVLGLSGSSADIRDVLVSGLDDVAGPSRTTKDVYLWRLRKYLGSYLAVVGSTKAIIFTDTIGETVPDVRWAMCADMQSFGVEVDPARNNNEVVYPRDIATDESPVRVLVIQTNEELAIARQSYEVFTKTVVSGGTR